MKDCANSIALLDIRRRVWRMPKSAPIFLCVLLAALICSASPKKKRSAFSAKQQSKFAAGQVKSPPFVNFIGTRHYQRVSSQIPVTVRARDKTGVRRIELYLDERLLTARDITPPSTDVNFSYDWNTNIASNGKHSLSAKAFNKSDMEETAYWTVIVQNTPIVASGNVIVVLPGVRFQTINGWEATAEGGQLYSPAWNNYRNALFDQAVNDLGINRIRLEIYSGTENPVDYFAQWRAGKITESQYDEKRFEIINDNSNPDSIDPAGFKWSQVDSTIDNLVLPLRQRLQARGESLWVSVNYVDFGSSSFEHKDNPAEYAEFVLAAYQHIQSRYGFVPNSWEVILEPDAGTANWSSAQVAQAIKAAGDLLATNGYTPNFVAPSTTNAANAPVYIDQIAATNGALKYVGEFSYHRYCCASTEVLQNIASRAVQHNKGVGMLEWIGADYNTIHEDLKVGRNTTWQQYVLAGLTIWGPDNGGSYYTINDSNQNKPVVIMNSRTKLLRQYFKFVRSGAQRIGAQSGNNNFDPLAFINANGKYVVVVKASSGDFFNILGLPAGTYGIKYTTSDQYDIDRADITINAGQMLTTSIPSSGVITIYAR